MASNVENADRSERAVALRVGTIVSVSTDLEKMTVAIADGQLVDVPMLTSITATAVGELVALLLTRDNAIVIGLVGAATGTGTGPPGPQGVRRNCPISASKPSA